MPQFSVTICQIQQGDEHLREEFIASQKEFIRSFASFICHRRLDWHDDELSISLIAFNRAIDTFDPGVGSNFRAYARFFIRNALVDYFRSQQRVKGINEAAATAELTAHHEKDASLKHYTLSADNLERAYEIEIFKDILKCCDLTLETLVKYSPRHRDTRENLKNIALTVSRNESLRERILKEKRLPVQEIQALCGVKRKLLEKWRRYLLSLIIIAGHGDLDMLTEYIWGKDAVLKT